MMYFNTNIGVANFTLKDASSTNPLHSVNIVTDESTGEFSTFVTAKLQCYDQWLKFCNW